MQKILMTYSDITKYFGLKLSDPDFKIFLKSISCDPNEYDITYSEYLISKSTGLELGFGNVDAIYDDDEQKVFYEGTPIFSLFNIHKPSEEFIKSLPFNIKFSDNRGIVREKAGQPVKIVDLDDKYFNKHFMIDHFLIDNIAISVDYNSKDETVELIQIRDNDQMEKHIKL